MLLRGSHERSFNHKVVQSLVSKRAGTIHYSYLSTHTLPCLCGPLTPVGGWCECIRMARTGRAPQKVVCNAIRMNKGLFNEEASLPLSHSQANSIVSLFRPGSKSSGTSNLPLLETGLTGSEHNPISREKKKKRHFSMHFCQGVHLIPVFGPPGFKNIRSNYINRILIHLPQELQSLVDSTINGIFK